MGEYSLSISKSLFCAFARKANTVSFNSSGRSVRRLIVPPTEPSIIFASGDFVTSTEEIKDAGKSSKLIPPRPAPAPTVLIPFISTLFWSVPRI